MTTLQIVAARSDGQPVVPPCSMIAMCGLIWYYPVMVNTESSAGAHPNLDSYAALDLVTALAVDHRAAVEAVMAATPALAQAVEAAAPRLAAGGRLVYAGAGTSGRLAVLDAVELVPTFSWPRERALCLIAGGPSAVLQAVENAEDEAEAGARDMGTVPVGCEDVAILVAASGRTPYTLGALAKAREAGALTVAIANNAEAPLLLDADIAISLPTGPEVVAGSTRLKAGTAQKIALNTLSTALMVRLHKTHGHLMVDVKATNAKLRERAVGLVTTLARCDADTARATLQACGWRVKAAVLALHHGLDANAAAARLAACEGWLRRALEADGVEPAAAGTLAASPAPTGPSHP